jgi:predicted ATP-grasp superfamily ATP-dependent carboligase
LTQPTVLVAALSGRALAASARRAGYAPLVVDAFGDCDTRASAGDLRCLAEATRTGFRAGPLFAALEALTSAARSPPIGLVLGSGFEDVPKLVAGLSRRFQLIGNDADQIARAKDPASFFALLAALGIDHPETRLDPPPDPQGWLSKRIGGSGGAHVVPCAAARSQHKRYSQRHIPGEPVSVLAVADGHSVRGTLISGQWSAGVAPRIYRYGGATGPIRLAPAVTARLTAAVEAVCGALNLVGLLSFDFVLADAIPYLLEVNPRPSATLDIFDDAAGSLFRAHLAACRGGKIELPEPQGASAAAILYADQGPLTLGDLAWPAWTADRPSPGTRIPRHRPIATVLTYGETATKAEQNSRRRLEELALMLYGRAPDSERDNAKTYRPRPERFGASSQTR